MTSQELIEATTASIPYRPTLREMAMLESPFDVKLAPEGEWAAINVRTAKWKDDCYDNVCYVCDTATGKMRRVNHIGSVNQMEWAGNDTLAVLKSKGDEKAQVWLYEGLVGEGWQVTDHKPGVQWFVYPGMGHPITKPCENHAIMHQNRTWFSHYLLGEDLALE